jgi:hypothetical protein
MSWEFDVGMTTNSGARVAGVFLSSLQSGLIGGPTEYAGIAISNADTGDHNWWGFSCSGGTLTFSASSASVTAAAYPNTKLRVEIHGTNSPYGKMSRFFVDGVLIGEVTSFVPTGVPLYPVLFVERTGADNTTATFGYVNGVWTRWGSTLDGGSV